MSRIYLAYAPADEARAEELRRILLARGHSPWRAPDPQPTSQWRPEMEIAIAEAEALALLLTAEAAQSVAVTYAWAFALGAGVPVIALIMETAAEHPRLQTVHRCALGDFGDENHFWDRFLDQLERALAGRPVAGRQAAHRPAMEAEIDRDLRPTAPGYWLVMRRGPLQNQMYQLERPLVSIGRDLANDIHIRDAQVSRFHLRLTLRGQAYHLEDLGSANGTRVNGAQISGSRPLADGDLIALGDALLLSYDLVYAD